MRILRVAPLFLLFLLPTVARAQGQCVPDMEVTFAGERAMSCELIGIIDMTMTTNWQRDMRRYRETCDGQNGFLRTVRDGRYLYVYCCDGIEDRPNSNAVVGLPGFTSLPGRPNPTMPPEPVQPTPPPPPPTPADTPLTPKPPPPPPPPPRPTELDCPSRTRVHSKILFGNAIHADVAEALRLAQENARTAANTDAQRVLAGYECKKPCRKDYMLDVRVSRNGVVNRIGSGPNAVYTVIVFAVWDMDIICVRIP